MSWQRLGLVHTPKGDEWWARSHAAFPTAQLRPGGRIRVFFTALDEQRDGRTGFVDLAADDPTQVVARSGEPVLDIGALGDFDDCGANAFGVETVGDETYLYYQGWQRTAKAPYLIFTGLAAGSGDPPSLRKVSPAPILDRTAEEPYIRGAPFVLREGGRWRMWYSSGTSWELRDGAPRYRVVIRSAESADGVRWVVEPRTCLAPAGAEYAVGRPCVLRDGEGFHMWYSIRSADHPYRIGYAESADGVAWTRLDGDGGLERAAAGWDSAMVCYSYVIDVGNRRYMFYNGNGHGATGFGVALWNETGGEP
jgi:hypothetical protein